MAFNHVKCIIAAVLLYEPTVVVGLVYVCGVICYLLFDVVFG